MIIIFIASSPASASRWMPARNGTARVYVLFIRWLYRMRNMKCDTLKTEDAYIGGNYNNHTYYTGRCITCTIYISDKLFHLIVVCSFSRLPWIIKRIFMVDVMPCIAWHGCCRLFCWRCRCVCFSLYLCSHHVALVSTAPHTWTIIRVPVLKNSVLVGDVIIVIFCCRCVCVFVWKRIRESEVGCCRVPYVVHAITLCLLLVHNAYAGAIITCDNIYSWSETFGAAKRSKQGK